MIKNALIRESLVLASRSPRRAEILQAVGWPFETMAADIDESLLEGEDAIDYVRRLAEGKAKVVAAKQPDKLVLGADTTVVIDRQILGQPSDPEDARKMLRLLNGTWHEVITGVALLRFGGNPVEIVDYETTRVHFAELSVEEIDWYVSTGEPLGKAGAYGIQGKAGPFIDEIQGDYFNIVGLPIRLVYELRQRLRSSVR
ncbi:MAG TPA: Maf family protein [Pyrinomonadaceae bacterium]